MALAKFHKKEVRNLVIKKAGKNDNKMGSISVDVRKDDFFERCFCV